MYAQPFQPRNFQPGSGINAPLDDQGHAAVHLAARRGDAEEVRRLARGNADLNQQDKDGRTALYDAVKRRDIPMIETLLENGATFRVLDKDGRTPFLYAMATGADEAFLEKLLSMGDKITFPSPRGRTAMHFAAEDGRADLLPWLASKGLSVDRRDDEGFAAAHIAAGKGDIPFLEALKAAKANFNIRTDKGRTPLYIAAIEKQEGSAGFLLDIPEVVLHINTLRSVKEGFTATHAAVHAGHVGIAEKIILKGGDPNLTDNTKRHSLFIAVEDGNLDMARMTVRLGADVRRAPRSSRNNTGMAHWIGGEDTGVYAALLQFLRAEGADLETPDNDGVTPLHKETMEGRWPRVFALLDSNMNPDRPDNTGRRPLDTLTEKYYFTDKAAVVQRFVDARASPGMSPDPQVKESPLHKVTRHGQHRSAGVLIAARAVLDETTRDDLRQTAFHIAAIAGHEEIGAQLADAGADPWKKDAYGRSAQHLAAMAGNTEFATFLFTLPGLEIDARDDAGLTALASAVRNGRPEPTRLFLSAGADPSAPDMDGDTPLHHAAHQGLRMLNIFAEAPFSKPPNPVNWKVVNEKTGDTLLHTAAASGEWDAIEFLVKEKGLRLDEKNKAGQTPREKAAAEGRLFTARRIEALETNTPQPAQSAPGQQHFPGFF